MNKYSITVKSTLITLAVLSLNGCFRSGDPAPVVTTAPVAFVSEYNHVGVEGQTISIPGYSGNAEGVTFAWTQISGAKAELLDADRPVLRFTAPSLNGASEALLAFKLTVSNRLGTSESQKVSVTIKPADNVVVETLSKKRTVKVGDQVSLHAVGTGGTQTTYEWTQVSPTTPLVTLTNATTANPTFVAPDLHNVSLQFKVRYVDSTTGRSAVDTTSVLVRKEHTKISHRPLTIQGAQVAPPQKLKLVAPPQLTLASSQAVKLAFSVRGGTQPYSWTWRQSTGPSVALASGDKAVLDFTAPSVNVPTTLGFEAAVQDSEGTVRTGTAYVRVVPPPGQVGTAVPSATQIREPVLAVSGTAVSILVPQLKNLAVVQTGGPTAQASVEPPLQPAATPSLRVVVTPPQIYGHSAPAEITITGTDSNGKAVEIVQPILVMRAPNLAAPAQVPPVVAAAAPQLIVPPNKVPGTTTYLVPDLLPSATPTLNTTLAAISGSSVTFSIPALKNAAAFQTSGPVAQALIEPPKQATATPSLAVVVTPPLVYGNATPAMIVVTGQDPTTGRNVEIRQPLLISQATPSPTPVQVPPMVTSAAPMLLVAPNKTPDAASVATPPVVHPNLTPNLVLTVMECGTLTDIDEGQAGVVLQACAAGGTGNYTYAWELIGPTSLVGKIALQNSRTSHPSFNAPAVTANTPLVWKVTVSDGQQTASARKTLLVNDLAASLTVSTLNDITAQSGQLVTLGLPVPTGGVPPYAWSVAQTAGRNVGINPSSPSFPVPVLAPGASDEVLRFEYTVTDGFGNTVKVSESVTIKAPPPVLAASLTGPSNAASGANILLNTSVTGGIPPYKYAYAVTGGSVTIPGVANPSVALPSLSPGGTDQTLLVSLSVTDSATPPKTVRAQALSVAVSAPPAPAAQAAAASAPATPAAQAAAAEQQVATELATATNTADGLAKILAASATLPPSVLTAGIPVLTTAALQTRAALVNDGTCPPLNFDRCVDTYLGDCNTDFAGMVSGSGAICYVVDMCMKSSGLCVGATPAMKALMEQNLLKSFQQEYPGCSYIGELGC